MTTIAERESFTVRRQTALGEVRFTPPYYRQNHVVFSGCLMYRKVALEVSGHVEPQRPAWDGPKVVVYIRKDGRDATRQMGDACRFAVLSAYQALTESERDYLRRAGDCLMLKDITEQLAEAARGVEALYRLLIASEGNAAFLAEPAAWTAVSNIDGAGRALCGRVGEVKKSAGQW